MVGWMGEWVGATEGVLWVGGCVVVWIGIGGVGRWGLGRDPTASTGRPSVFTDSARGTMSEGSDSGTPAFALGGGGGGGGRKLTRYESPPDGEVDGELFCAQGAR